MNERRDSAQAAKVKIVECPRDAWQALPQTIPVSAKVAYHRLLIAAGFRHVDAVSFVSPHRVPQMADSEEVLRELFPDGTTGGIEIIGIVVNQAGLKRALAAPAVGTIGYPHSVSEGFLRRNQGLSIEESRALVREMREAADAAGRGLVVYLSMAFGNPYGDPWSESLVADESRRIREAGVRTISLADTAGQARPERVREMCGIIGAALPETEIGLHLHSRPEEAARKVLAGLDAGCRRFDGALSGLGGCPFAGDALVGNIATETLVGTVEARGFATGIPIDPLLGALAAARWIRSRFGTIERT